MCDLLPRSQEHESLWCSYAALKQLTSVLYVCDDSCSCSLQPDIAMPWASLILVFIQVGRSVQDTGQLREQSNHQSCQRHSNHRCACYWRTIANLAMTRSSIECCCSIGPSKYVVESHAAKIDIERLRMQYSRPNARASTSGEQFCRPRTYKCSFLSNSSYTTLPDSC